VFCIRLASCDDDEGNYSICGLRTRWSMVTPRRLVRSSISSHSDTDVESVAFRSVRCTTVKEALRILSWKFSSAGAVVDTSVHDPCRITKVPGTMSRKGPYSEDRPWRQSKLLSAPSISRRLTYADLIELQKYAPPPEPKNIVVTPAISQKKMREFFAQHKHLIHATSWTIKRDGTTYYYLNVCPFNDFLLPLQSHSAEDRDHRWR